MNCGRGKGLRVDLSSGANRSCFGGVCGGWKWVGAGCYPRNVTCHGISGAWLPAAEVCRLGLYAGASSKKPAVRSSSSSSSPYIPPLSFALRSSDCLTECPAGCCPEENWFCCPDNIYCAATAEDCPGTSCSCGVLDDNPNPSENELPAKCRDTCCCPADDGTPSNFKNLPWCSGVSCGGAGALSVSSAPLFEPGVCVGTECPAGCCPGENWFCCPDNIYCASEAQYCPSVESLDGSTTNIAGVEINLGRYFDVFSPPMQAFSGITGGQFVVPEWLGYNLAVYIDSSGFKNAEWVVPRQILNFQSTILLGYQPIGEQAPGVLPPPAFTVSENIGNAEVGSVYKVSVTPVSGATGYVFRFNGVAIRPDYIGPQVASNALPEGLPSLGENEYLYTTELDGYAMTAASTNGQGTGSFSEQVQIGLKPCDTSSDCSSDCEGCVDGKCQSNCADGESCVDGECQCVDGECGGSCDCGKLTCCSCQDIGDGYTTAIDRPGDYTSLPWVYPYKTCCPPGTTYDGDDLCRIDDPDNWGYNMFSCGPDGGMCIQSLLLQENVECLCDGKCIGLDYEDVYLEAQAPAKQVPANCKYWVCEQDEEVTSTVNGKKYTYKVNKCYWRERTYGNYFNYLARGYNTKKQCCAACDCETTGACCQWNTADPTQAACSQTTEKACNETTPTPGWSRSFLGVGSTCTNCRRVTGSPDNPLPPAPPPPPPPPPPSSSTSPPPSSSSVSDSSSSSSSSKTDCSIGGCEILRDNSNPTEEELSKDCQEPCCCPQFGGGKPAFSKLPYCTGFDYENNCDGISGPSF